MQTKETKEAEEEAEEEEERDRERQRETEREWRQLQVQRVVSVHGIREPFSQIVKQIPNLVYKRVAPNFSYHSQTNRQ